MKESDGETLFHIEAKIGGNSKRREILYSFIEPLDNFYMKKTEIYRAQIQACRNLSKFIRSNEEIQMIDKEISQLKSTLNIQPL